MKGAPATRMARAAARCPLHIRRELPDAARIEQSAILPDPFDHPRGFQMLRVRFLPVAVAAALMPAIAFAQAAPPPKEKVTISTQGSTKVITNAPGNAATKAGPTAGTTAGPNAPEAKPSRFDEIDTNHDGFVSREEYTAAEDKRFQEFDTNHDGKIDPKEIASSPPLMERNLRTAERMAKQWDANGDGIVTRAEFDASAKERFDKQDKDKTGKLARKPMPTMNQMPGVQMPGVKPGTMPPIKPVPPQPATPDPAPKPKN